VVATLAEYLYPVQVLFGLDNLNKEKPISLRKWIREGTGWLFLPFFTAYASLLAPLYSALVNLLMIETLMLPDYPAHKTFFILDELGNLLKLPKLSQLIAVGRSKNAGVILGTQTVAKLNSIYSADIVRDIMNNCNLKVIFRVNDPASAKFASELLGEAEVEEKRRTDSLGVMDYKDGVSISTSVATRPVVLPGELMHLPNLNCYLKIFDLFPARDEVLFKKFENKIDSFIKREIPSPVYSVLEENKPEQKQLISEQKPEQKAEVIKTEQEQGKRQEEQDKKGQGEERGGQEVY
jgi:type IV secretory pathway TraG/TraD family ATPase VirD4